MAAWRSASRSPAQTPRVTIFGTDSLSTTDAETSGLADSCVLAASEACPGRVCVCGWFGDALRRAILAREPIDTASVYDGRWLANVKREQAVALCT